MSEELKAIDFLRAKTITYELSSEELHYSLILYNLIMNLQRENEKLKEQLQQKEDIINKAKEYIINNSLYEEEYDYDYEENIYLSGIHDDDVRRILVEILDNKGEVTNGK